MFKIFKRKKKKYIQNYPSTSVSPEEEEIMHRQELARMVQAMDCDECKIVVENVPISYIMQRILDEINMKQIMEMRIKELEGLIKGGDQNG